MNRRRFGMVAGGSLASLAFAGIGRAAAGHRDDVGPRFSGAAAANDGRLTTRPRKNTTTSAGGTHPLGLDRARDAVLQIPANVPAAPLPLLVLLHGAGGSGEGVLRRFAGAAEEAGVAVLAPSSRGQTWDGIRDGFGVDIPMLDRALERVFGMVAIDPARIAVGGFSDGASYALSLGLINGDLFPRVVACSPGFIIQGTAHGKPRFFISHGTADQILPIDQCSRMIVPALRRRGYDITFREFEGGHQVPPEIALEGMRWLAERK